MKCSKQNNFHKENYPGAFPASRDNLIQSLLSMKSFQIFIVLQITFEWCYLIWCIFNQRLMLLKNFVGFYYAMHVYSLVNATVRLRSVHPDVAIVTHLQDLKAQLKM